MLGDNQQQRLPMLTFLKSRAKSVSSQNAIARNCRHDSLTLRNADCQCLLRKTQGGIATCPINIAWINAMDEKIMEKKRGTKDEKTKSLQLSLPTQGCRTWSTSCQQEAWGLSHSVVSDRQAPLSLGFSKQEYWSGLACPPPGDLPNPGIEPRSPALAGGFCIAEPPGKDSD